MMKKFSDIQCDELFSFCENHMVALLVLFGSGASGKLHAESDMDLAIQFSVSTGPSKLQLIHELELVFEPYRIDLVVLNKDTPPLLVYEIFSKGRLLYEETEGLFEKGRLRAWHLYQDTVKIRQREKDYIQNRLRGVRHVT